MKQLGIFFIFGIIGLVIGVMLILILRMNARPDLSLWHTAKLDLEPSAPAIQRMSNLDDYRKREDALFRQLGKKVLRQVPMSGSQMFNRYCPGSWSDPDRFAVNWNRTFELSVDRPRAGVLMLHGLSDSPYSLRALARHMHRQQMWVVGLRLPGHGTVPAGLAHVHWQDFTAAVRLAARDLAEKIGPRCPLVLVGYSNGAALAVEYTLSRMSGEKLPCPAGLVLISPAVSVSPMAALARWNLRLSYLPGLEKMAWLSIKPEFDPYKYNSFPVNAGDQIYRLTRRISTQVRDLSRDGAMSDFPPVLAFQSMADATIPPRGIVDNLLIHLAADGHRLVLFDINRQAEITPMFSRDPGAAFEDLYARTLPFDLEVITNSHPDSPKVSARRKSALSDKVRDEPLNASWPPGIYSLSHVALPFNARDMVYGLGPVDGGRRITLGRLEPRGEKDLLNVSIPDLMRLRYNPFFDYLAQQTVDWALAAVK